MPDTNIPNIDFDKTIADINNALKEAAYVAVGLGVLGFQRAQVQRVELQKQLETYLSEARAAVSGLNGTASPFSIPNLSELWANVEKIFAERPETAVVVNQLTELAKAVDEAVAPARQQFDEQLDRFEEALPEAARNVVHSVRTVATTQERALRSAVGLA